MTWRQKRKWSDDEFAEAVKRTVKEASADVVAQGLATLEAGVDAGGEYLALRPVRSQAAEIDFRFDYPTVSIGGEHTTEMFGPEEERLRELPKLIRAVIDGRFEWRRLPPDVRLRPFTFRLMSCVEGVFHTDEGPWTFRRYGADDGDLPDAGSYEPYLPSATTG